MQLCKEWISITPMSWYDIKINNLYTYIDLPLNISALHIKTDTFVIDVDPYEIARSDISHRDQ